MNCYFIHFQSTTYFVLFNWIVINLKDTPFLNSRGELKKLVPKGSSLELPCFPSILKTSDTWFRWKKDGLNLINSRNIINNDLRLSISLKDGSLIITNVTYQDEGVYICQTFDVLGSAMLQITIYVIEKLTSEMDQSRLDFQDHNLNNGLTLSQDVHKRMKYEHLGIESGLNLKVNSRTSSIKSSCIKYNVKCYSSLKLRSPNFIFRQKHTPFQRLNEKLNFGENFLRLEKIINFDDSQYFCLVQNQTQSFNQTFIIHIYGRREESVIESNGMNTTVKNGNRAILHCELSSKVIPHIHWLKWIGSNRSKVANQSTLKSLAFNRDSHFDEKPTVVRINGEYYQILKSSIIIERRKGYFVNSLEFEKAQDSDSGRYLCLGISPFGYTFKSAFLIVLSSNTHRHHHFHHLQQLGENIPLIHLVSFGLLSVLLILALINCYKAKFIPSIPDLTHSYSDKKLIDCKLSRNYNIKYERVKQVPSVPSFHFNRLKFGHIFPRQSKSDTLHANCDCSNRLLN